MIKFMDFYLKKKKKRLACTTWNECKLSPEEERRRAQRAARHAVRAEKQKTKKKSEGQ